MSDYILELQNITKEFPGGVKALNNVNIKVKRGEVHALCGENGAGKSTLINIICGVYPQATYDGKLVYEGSEQSFKNISNAENKGIVCVHQELALVPEMTVIENIYLGRQSGGKGIINGNELYKNAVKMLEMIGINTEDGLVQIDPHAKVKTLGTGHQQLIEIAKALSKNAKVLLLDEPTASLTEREADNLLDIVEELRKQGLTCIYISHKLDEVFRIADSISVIRDGEAIGTYDKNSITMDEVIRHMVGREMSQLFPRVPHTRGEAALEVKNYSVDRPGMPGTRLIKDVSFTAYSGEILGVSGLIGAGRTELFTSLFGAFDAAAEGEVIMYGEKVSFKNPKAAIRKGFMLATEDRKTTGLFLGRSIKDNTTISSMEQVTRAGVIDVNKEVVATNEYMAYMKTKAKSFATKAGNLSGGNQQKVVLAKAMMTKPRVLVLDEPTRGIDVGAKYEIYNIMNQLVEEGVCVIMISSEMEEILGMSDHIIVMSEGELKLDLDINEATSDRILAASAK